MRFFAKPVHWSVRCVQQQTPASLKLAQTVFLGCWVVAKGSHHRLEQRFRDWARGIIEVQARLRRTCGYDGGTPLDLRPNTRRRMTSETPVGPSSQIPQYLGPDGDHRYEQ